VGGNKLNAFFSSRGQSLNAAPGFGFTEFAKNLPFLVGVVVFLIYYHPQFAESGSLLAVHCFGVTKSNGELQLFAGQA
jgi:hypothetical protein